MASGRVPNVISIFMKLQLSRRIKVGRESTQTSFQWVTVFRFSCRIPREVDSAADDGFREAKSAPRRGRLQNALMIRVRLFRRGVLRDKLVQQRSLDFR